MYLRKMILENNPNYFDNNSEIIVTKIYENNIAAIQANRKV